MILSPLQGIRAYQTEKASFWAGAINMARGWIECIYK
jgi:hypothetical protein